MPRLKALQSPVALSRKKTHAEQVMAAQRLVPSDLPYLQGSRWRVGKLRNHFRISNGSLDRRPVAFRETGHRTRAGAVRISTFGAGYSSHVFLATDFGTTANKALSYNRLPRLGCCPVFFPLYRSRNELGATVPSPD